MNANDYRREYYPCSTGLHVCGSTPDGERPLTVANVPRVDRWLFEKFRAEFSSGNDGDLVVDFFEKGDLVDDFWMRRQDLDNLLTKARRLG